MGWRDWFGRNKDNILFTAIGAIIGIVAASFVTITIIIAVVVIVAVVLLDVFGAFDTSLPDFPNVATDLEFYYHASIHRNDVHTCSGAFIGTYFILTVANCVYTYANNQLEKSNLKVYVGIDEVPCRSRNSYSVDKITVHPDYFADRLAYNVAVLKLTEKVTQPSHAGPVFLPRTRMNIEDTTVLVSGFTLNREVPEMPTHMTQSTMKVIEYNICHSHFFKALQTSAKFCVIPFPRWKPCQTSRGGPAVNGDKILIGLFVMQNPAGCAKDLPEIFVDVSRFLNFIENEIK